MLSPQKLLPDRTTFTTPLPNIDIAVIDLTAGTIEVAFRNNVGVPINVTGGDSNGASVITGCDVVNTATDVTRSDDPGNSAANGDTFLVEWTCTGVDATIDIGDKFDEEFTFFYENTETGQIRRHTGSVQGKWS